MIIKTIDINPLEANQIFSGKRMFMFRNSSNRYYDGDVIQFRVIKNRRTIPHEINSRRYVITTVMNHDNAPVEDGYQFVGFAKLDGEYR